jgi:hypothetical protein
MKFMIYRRKTELLFNTLNNCVRYLETTNHSFDACATSSVEVSERNKGGEKPRGKEAENVSLSRDQLRSREGCGTEGDECDIATSNEEYDDRNCGDDRASLKNVFHKEKKNQIERDERWFDRHTINIDNDSRTRRSDGPYPSLVVVRLDNGVDS